MGHKTRLKLNVITCTAMLIALIFSFYLIYTGAAIPGLNPRGDEEKEAILIRNQVQSTIEGSVLDRSGSVITSASVAGVRGACLHPSCSYIAGYYSAETGGTGIRGLYAKYLYDPGKDGRGCDITLTIDSALQDHCAALLRDYTKGSIVVLDVSTAQILALADRNTVDYDVNLLDDKDTMAEYNSIDNFWLMLSCRVPEAPGSVFKVITASALEEHGWSEMVYHDTGTEMQGGHHIVNHGGYSYGDVTLRKAFVKSINTYFAHFGCMLGVKVIANKASDFLVGEQIKLDFVTLSSNFDLGDGNRALLADSCYGQGRTLITPLHLSMIGQAIANGGEMLRPYMVLSITDDSKTVYRGAEEVIAHPVSADIAARIMSHMNAAASSYGLGEGICAKSGTAEVSDYSDLNHAWLLTFDERNVVLVSVNDTHLAGSQLTETALAVYSYLNEAAE